MGLSLKDLYEKQVRFQINLLEKKAINPVVLPVDSTHWFKYHCLAMVEEMGELLSSDKRWKTHRNEKYDLDEKKKEIADVIITAINISIYSGITADELTTIIFDKIQENSDKLSK